MHADVIDVQRVGGATARIAFARSDDTLAVLNSALVAHGLCVASSAVKTWDRAASSRRRIERLMSITTDPQNSHGRPAGTAGLEALTSTDELVVIVSGQVGDRFGYLNEGSFLVSGITIQRSSVQQNRALI